MGHKAVALVAVVALAGLGGLYAYATTLEPIPSPISSLDPGDVGSVVKVVGMLRDPWPTSAGGFLFDLVDPETSAEVQVYLPGTTYAGVEDRAGLVPGALVQVLGEVQDYRGELEIHVTRGTDVVVLARPADNRLPVAVVARNPAAFEGMELVLQGRVDDLWSLRSGAVVVGTALILTDDAAGGYYSIRCITWGWDWRLEPRGVAEGRAITFTGVLEYYPGEALWQVTSEGFSLQVLS